MSICSAPKWRLDCNKCSFLIYLPESLHAARVSKDKLCTVVVPPYEYVYLENLELIRRGG